jgi:hypothetical protein
LGKNPYACRDKARHHGFTNANIGAFDDTPAVGSIDENAVSSSYMNWTQEEDSCLLAYIEEFGASQWSAGTSSVLKFKYPTL